MTSHAIFNVPPRIIYQALATQDGWHRLGLGKRATFTAETGTAYSVLDGMLTGKVLEVKENHFLHLTMKFGDWAKDVPPMDVKIEFKEIPGGQTEVNVTHTNIYHRPGETPEQGRHRVEQMWEQSCWSILDKIFGYGRQRLDD